MEYGKAAVDLLLSGKDDLVQRGEAMIAYLSSLPADILPAEEKNLLIAMMTVGVAGGGVSWSCRQQCIRHRAIGMDHEWITEYRIDDNG